ncbi:MAG: hypothetical protein IT266_07230 [Saprospiraceae bacterium]|nr:hypothetical protein [Saprospiraceae bacterium]
MYDLVLSLHSWLRWVVLALGIYALYVNYRGWKFGLLYGAPYKRINTWFIASLHTQLVLGLVLYLGLSDMMKGILSDFGASMKNAEMRFWSVEHLTGMLAAIAIAQIGSIRAAHSCDGASAYRTAFTWFAIALALIVLMIPFGLWNVERPWFRI